jgi:Kef-type K+ transport system membrane component KefB
VPVDTDLTTLFVIALIAATTPLLIGLFRLPVPEVVLLLVFGAVFGPSLLGLIHLSEPIGLLKEVGLAFLFFVAGYELDQEAIKGRSGKLAGAGWLISLAVSLVVVWPLTAMGLVRDSLGVAICLTSTALGTLLPMLRDRGDLSTPFGKYFMGAGAAGEFGPILAISLLLSSRSSFTSLLILTGFAIVAVLVYLLPPRLARPEVLHVVEDTRETSAQSSVRWVLVLLFALLAFASVAGLDVVLGAFIAGVVLKLWMVKEDPEGDAPLDKKIEGIAFGFFIPLFFIISGASLDLAAIAANPMRLLTFFVLLLVVRGLPQLFLYRSAIPATRERWRFTLYVATGLPIIVAVTTIGLQTGIMLPENAAALVGAGALSVLIFPFIADRLVPRGSKAPDPSLTRDAT